MRREPVTYGARRARRCRAPTAGGTGFAACGTRGGTPRLHGARCEWRVVGARYIVPERRARRCRAPTAGGTSMRKPGMAGRRVVWALARFLHRKHLPGEKEKNALADARPRFLAPKRHRANASRSLGKAFFSFSPALGTHGAQKRAKAHIPGLLQDHARVSLIVSGFPAYSCLSGGTGFRACGTRGGTPRLHGALCEGRVVGARYIVPERRARRPRAPTAGGTGFRACGNEGLELV